MKPPRNSRNFGSGGLDALEYELLQEKAFTLGRLGRRLEASLAELRAFDAAGTGDAAARDALVAAAGESAWYYLIQRELTGFRDNDTVLRELGVPREVQARMGVRQKRTR